MNAVDRQTAEEVGLRVPGLSSRDSNVLSKLLGGEDGEGGCEIFDRCPVEFKGKLRVNILKAQGRIPTLVTLFEDLGCLEPLASSMKLLLDPTAKRTSIHTLFLKIFYGNESEFVRGYRAVYLFCMQTFLNWCCRRGKRQSVRGQQFLSVTNAHSESLHSSLALLVSAHRRLHPMWRTLIKLWRKNSF